VNLPSDCQLTCYTVGSHAMSGVPLTVPPASLGNVRWGNALNQKLEMGERHINHWILVMSWYYAGGDDVMLIDDLVACLLADVEVSN